jgi:hypothetical protein
VLNFKNITFQTIKRRATGSRDRNRRPYSADSESEPPVPAPVEKSPLPVIAIMNFGGAPRVLSCASSGIR